MKIQNMKKKKERLTITISPELLEFIENNYTKKSKFVEYCIMKELEYFIKKEENYVTNQNCRINN